MSIDTNILLPAVETKNAHHVKAAAFLESITARDDVAISELALVELYVLLRNPAVLGNPLTSADAAKVCDEFRRHPAWQIICFPSDRSQSLTPIRLLPYVPRRPSSGVSAADDRDSEGRR